MTRPDPHVPDLPAGLRSLNLPAYCTWAAVTAAPLLSLLGGRLPLSGPVLLGLLALPGFLLLYVVRDRLSLHRGLRDPAVRAAVVGQLPLALIACYTLPYNTNAILLIIAAAQLFAVFTAAVALAWLAVANALLLIILLLRLPAAEATVVWLSFAGFQGFAALLTHAVRRTEIARAEAQRANAELRAAQRLLAEGARAQERLHLSRELHDVAGHKLTALKLQLHLLERKAPAALVPATAQCRQLVEELLRDLRSVVSALRQHDHVDLQQALRAYIDAFPQFEIRLELDPQLSLTDMNHAETLLRCAQEGILNAVRHSRGTQIAVRLRQGESGVRLEVEDNGRGAGGAAPGNGLTGLRERVAALSGELRLEPRSQGGTRLSVSLPA